MQILTRLNVVFLTVAFLGTLSYGFSVYAQGAFKPADCDDLGIRCEVKDTKGTAFRVLLEDIIAIALSFIAIVAAAVMIYGGALFLTSAGDESKAEKAKKLMLYAVIGLIIIGLSAVIVNFTLRAIR